MYIREVSVCLSVCLFGFGAPVKFWKKSKNPNFAHMALDGGRDPFALPFAASFAQLKKYSNLFLPPA